jgi:glycerophosphoryl diester phosphodiesterase
MCIAHRGASSQAPENTLRAFECARTLGADGIELDAQTTRDGIPVVFHDDCLRRLTGKRGRLSDFSWAELRHLRVGGEAIPSLREALAFARGRLLVQIEIKKGARVGPVVNAVRATRTAGGVIVASFERAILREAAALAPAIPRMLIADPGPRSSRTPAAVLRLARAAVSLGAAGISLNHRCIDSPRLVEAIHRRGLRLWCWTVGDRRVIRRLSNWGVDGLIGNDPKKIGAVFQLTPPTSRDFSGQLRFLPPDVILHPLPSDPNDGSPCPDPAGGGRLRPRDLP